MIFTARHVRSSLVLLTGLMLASCTHRFSIAGSTTLQPGQPIVLLATSPSPTDIQIQLWNRGPGEVRFVQRQPAGDSNATGMLGDAGREHTWRATTARLELCITADSGPAEIAYTMSSNGIVAMSCGVDAHATDRQ